MRVLQPGSKSTNNHAAMSAGDGNGPNCPAGATAGIALRSLYCPRPDGPGAPHTSCNASLGSDPRLICGGSLRGDQPPGGPTCMPAQQPRHACLLGLTLLAADKVVDKDVLCRSAKDCCDVAEYCDGTSSTCPANGYQPSTQVCRCAFVMMCGLASMGLPGGCCLLTWCTWCNLHGDMPQLGGREGARERGQRGSWLQRCSATWPALVLTGCDHGCCFAGHPSMPVMPKSIARATAQDVPPTCVWRRTFRTLPLPTKMRKTPTSALTRHTWHSSRPLERLASA